MRRHVILVRHGQSTMNAERALGEERLCGQFETPLTTYGREQATTAGRLLAARPELRITHAVSSVLSRAVETLDLLLAELPPTVVRLAGTPDLNERSLGRLEGLQLSEAFRRFPELARGDALERARGDYEARAPGGENLREVADRAWSALERLRRASGLDGLLVVSHAMTIRCLAGRALGRAPDAWNELPVKNSKPIVLRAPSDDEAWEGRMELAE